MSRTVNIFSRPHGPASGFDDLLSDTVYEEPDPSAALTISGHDQALICQQYVVFSATFRVPAFYFTVCRVSELPFLNCPSAKLPSVAIGGAPLPLGEIMETSLFKMGACDGFETSSCAVSLPTSTFPVLSHGDHPTLGTPCWYFHPCETTSVIDELMREVLDDGWDEITRLIRWLELWFMVVCSVVNL